MTSPSNSNVQKIAEVLKKYPKIAVRILNGDKGLTQLVEYIKRAREKKQKKNK